ncbi:MAG: hypothetical protein ACPIOQ_26415, partial [Promethearchaeia archaeon]
MRFLTAISFGQGVLLGCAMLTFLCLAAVIVTFERGLKPKQLDELGCSLGAVVGVRRKARDRGGTCLRTKEYVIRHDLKEGRCP